MKNTYIHLASEERDKIAILRAKGLSLGDIAEVIGRDKNTFSRELKRNKSPIYMSICLTRQMHALKSENVTLADAPD